MQATTKALKNLHKSTSASHLQFTEKLQQRKEERHALGKSTSSSLNKSRTSSTESSKSQRSNSRDLSATSSVEGAVGGGVGGVAGGVMTPRTARKLQKTKAILLSPTKLLPPKSKSEEGTETTGGEREEARRRGQVNHCQSHYMV